jgi:hypothetical protein
MSLSLCVIYGYMDTGSGLTLGLAPNISYKKRQHKKRYSVGLPAIYMQVVGGLIVYTMYVKTAVLLAILLYLCRNLSIARRLFLTRDIKSIMSFVVGTLFAKSFFAAASSNGFLCRS